MQHLGSEYLHNRVCYTGEDNATPETAGKIAMALGAKAFEKLRSADMPAWMSKAVAEAALPADNG